MNKSKYILMAVTLVVIGLAAGLLNHLKASQRLGAPGVKTSPQVGKRLNVDVLLPEQVLDYSSQWLPQSEIVTNVLPGDTSFGSREYFPPGSNMLNHLTMNVVLMGTDRTSIHKPQFCLVGQGWRIDDSQTKELTIPVAQPQPYDLPVVRIVSTREFSDGKGQSLVLRGIYVYWFVADGALSGDMSGGERMWSMAKHMLTTGELQRWAYVSLFGVCLPGQEETTYERMKAFISAAVPEFQLTPKPGEVLAARKP